MESVVHGMLSNAMAVTVLAVLVAVLGRVCRRPALIHSICLVAILKLVTPPLVPVAMPLPLPSSWRPLASPVAEEVGTTEVDFDPEMELKAAGVLAYLDGIDESRSAGEPIGDDWRSVAIPPAAMRWEPIVLGVMLAGALAWWSLALVRIVRFHRVLRDVEPMPAEWQARIGELAGCLTLRRPPVVCMVPGDVPPMLWAVGLRPRLLVPRQLWATLGDEQRRALVLHELAHLKRRDHWVRWIELVIAGLYWWHPAVWWLRRALREAEEQCCDAWVVWAMPRGARTYATALVAALEYVSGARHVPAGASVAASATIGNGHVSSLKRRLRMIVRAKTPKGLSLVGRLAVVGLAALLLPLAPSWAQKDKSATPEAEQSQPDRSNAAASLKSSLKDELVVLEKKIAEKKVELKTLAAKGLAGSKSVPEDQYKQVTSMLLQTEMERLETQADLEAAQEQNQKARERRDEGAQARLEARIKNEFQNDPDAVALVREINATKKELEQVRARSRAAADPARVRIERELKDLHQKWESLWQQEHDVIAERLIDEDASIRPDVGRAKISELRLKLDKLKKKRLSLADRIKNLDVQGKTRDADNFNATMANQELTSLLRMRDIVSQKLDQLEFGKDSFLVAMRGMGREVRPIQPPKAEGKGDDKDDNAKDDKGRSVAERIEKQLKELVDKLGKDASPVGQEVRKALERSVGEIHRALEKDGMTADELRRAVEKSREDLRKSFEAGGPVQKEMREAMERARKEMRETMEHGRQEAERVREEMHRQMQEIREQQRKDAAEGRDSQKKAPDAVRKMAEAMRERARKDRADREREQLKAREIPKPDAADRSNRGELDAARKQIRDLQQQLERATRHLNELQGRDSRRSEPPARPAEPRRPERPARQAEPARPATPARPPTPARPARPETPRGNLQPGRDGDDNDRRFRELEDKMNRLLKELEELKGRKTPASRTLARL